VRAAYLDAFSGLAGDMIVGALLDAGLPLEGLRRELGRLGLEGWQVRLERRERGGIAAAKFVVEIDGGHRHDHRPFREVRRVLSQSELAPRVAELALRIFERLAEAEGKVHGVDPEEVVFHEVGAIDSIVDVVGAAWGITALGIEALWVSSLPLGRGFTHSQHGPIPVPGPATVELLKGFPVRPGEGQGELVTPSGAAIVSALARPGAPPEMTIERIGYGAGDRDLPDRPNLLRILVGSVPGAVGTDRLLLLEANLDDLNPQFYDWTMERLFAAGARDVFLAPVQMKKNRPGVLLRVLCDPARRDEIAGVLFAETTTLGVRVLPCERLRLEREIREVDTRFGRVRVKIARGPAGTSNVAPEYDDCRRLAEATGTPLKTIYQEALRLALG
jgi:hypothetical protein